MQPDHQKFEHLSFLSVLLFTLALISPFIFFGLFIMPPHWLAGMDGYFYGNMIKTYLNQFHFTALDTESPLNYPSYFFYYLGMVGRIFNITDLGHLQYIGFLSSYSAFSIGTYFLLRPIFSGPRAAGAVVAMVLFSAFGWGSVHVWQKPHEVIACLGFSGMLAYVHNIFSAQQTSKIHRVFAGLATAFAVASYTPFMIAPIFAGAICALFACVQKFNNGIKSCLSRIIDPPFVLSFFALATPYILSLLTTLLTHDKGLGVVTWFHETDLRYPFLSSSPLAASYYATFILIACVTGLTIFRKNEITVTLLFPVIMVFTGLIAYAHLGYAYEKGDYTTAPFKYFLHIPFAGGLLLAALFPLNLFNKIHVTKWDLNSATVIIVLMTTLCGTSAIYYNYRHSGFEQALELSNARWKNIEKIVGRLDELKVNKKIERYLGSYEATFFNYYVKGKFSNHIIFNHSYASTYENIPARALALKEAASKEAEALYSHLKEARVDILILQTDASDKNNYIISFVENSGKEMSLPRKIHIPVKTMQKMATLNLAEYELFDGYHLYIIK